MKKQPPVGTVGIYGVRALPIPHFCRLNYRIWAFFSVVIYDLIISNSDPPIRSGKYPSEDVEKHIGQLKSMAYTGWKLRIRHPVGK